MKLKDVEIVPAVIVNASDPRNAGRIKVNAPTLFDPETPIKELPWIHPFCMPGYQYYSRMRDGGLVWVINVPFNYHEYWYIPFFKLCFDTQGIADQGDDVDILFDRNDGGSEARLYYTPNDGIKGENHGYYYQLLPDGVFKLYGASECGMNVDNGKVKIGNFSPGTVTQAVRYDELEKTINELADNLNKAAEKLSLASCGACGAAACLNKAATDLKKSIIKAKSDRVELVEN